MPVQPHSPRASKRDRHLSLSPEVDDILSALAEEDAAADGLGAEPNRSATVARLVLAERARRGPRRAARAW